MAATAVAGMLLSGSLHAAVPTVTLSASPQSIVLGATTELTWSSTGATSCTAGGSWSGAQATSGSSTLTPTRTGSLRYSLTCRSTGAGGGSSTASVTVTVSAPPPSVSVTVSPTTITLGASATVAWSVSNATSCTASGAWSGSKSRTGGSTSVKPTSTGTLTYTLTCSGSSSTSSSASLQVNAPQPTVALAVSPASIVLGSSATLTWSSTNATSCTASGSWSGTLATSGSQSVTPAAAGSYSYVLTCAGTSGSGSAIASLGVSATAAPVATLTPAALVYANQATGTTSAVQTATLANTGTGTLGLIAISVTGDFAQTSTCGSTLASGSSCKISVSFSPTLTGARSGTLSVASNAAASPVSVALSGTGTAPSTTPTMSLISRAVPIYASSAKSPASNANDASYSTEWRSNGVPATLALDLSAVASAQRQSVQLVWYNDDTYGYDHKLLGGVGYNNAGSYTIEANAAAGGGAAPTTGWVVLATLAGNTLHSYSHDVSFAGYNWIRANFSASDGSSGNSDIALNLDVYDASNGVTDGWFFNGDSITANCMGHGNITDEDANNPGKTITIAAQSFGQQVNGIVGNNTPLQENAGMPGWTSASMAPYLPGWLQNVPGKYVTINLGTNDAGGGVAPATFYANMAVLVQDVIAAGKIPIVPTIPYSTDPTHVANIPGLNVEIRALYQAFPTLVPGPDLYTYFLDNPNLIRYDDHLHPNAQGCAAYRTLWAQLAASTFYAPSPATAPAVRKAP